MRSRCPIHGEFSVPCSDTVILVKIEKSSALIKPLSRNGSYRDWPPVPDDEIKLNSDSLFPVHRRVLIPAVSAKLSNKFKQR